MMKLHAKHAPESAIAKSIQTMYNATANDRGTVQALAKELNEVNEDGSLLSHFVLGDPINSIVV
jgi:hypothetical protein